MRERRGVDGAAGGEGGVKEGGFWILDRGLWGCFFVFNIIFYHE